VAMLLYFAPETVLPIASAAAAAIGGFLLFFRRGATATKAVFDRLFRRGRGSDRN